MGEGISVNAKERLVYFWPALMFKNALGENHENDITRFRATKEKKIVHVLLEIVKRSQENSSKFIANCLTKEVRSSEQILMKKRLLCITILTLKLEI